MSIEQQPIYFWNQQNHPEPQTTIPKPSSSPQEIPQQPSPEVVTPKKPSK